MAAGDSARTGFSFGEELGQQRDFVCAVIVAGGTGSRFGNPGGKQLVELAERPMLSWTIEAFDRAHTISHIVVVCPAERREEMKRLIQHFTTIVPNPEERIMNAIADTHKYGMWDRLRLPPRDLEAQAPDSANPDEV